MLWNCQRELYLSHHHLLTPSKSEREREREREREKETEREKESDVNLPIRKSPSEL